MVLSKLITVILYVFTSHLELEVTEFYRDVSGRLVLLKGKGSPYSITERTVPELIPVLGSQPACRVSHNPVAITFRQACSYPRNA